MSEKLVAPHYVVQKYDMYGNKLNGKIIQHSPYGENVILINSITRFVDNYNLQLIEFLIYKEFPSIKVTTKLDEFYLTLEPWNSYED